MATAPELSLAAAPTVEFQDLAVSYGGRPVLSQVNLRIAAGSRVVLLGPSGSGKTTLLKCVNRLVSPAAGRVLVDGQDVATQDPVKLRRRIGYVMQAGGLFPHRTVAQNIATVPLLNGMPRRQAGALAARLLETVGLEAELAGRYPGQLSGGQQQRVGVARALATQAGLYLMDEPFGAVDPINRRALQQEVLRLHSQLGATILFVTHDVEEALLLGQQIVVLNKGGQIAQVGSAKELLERPATPYVADLLRSQEADRELRADASGAVFDATGRQVGVLRP